jgi:hypothetical protein
VLGAIEGVVAAERAEVALVADDEVDEVDEDVAGSSMDMREFFQKTCWSWWFYIFLRGDLYVLCYF